MEKKYKYTFCRSFNFVFIKPKKSMETLLHSIIYFNDVECYETTWCIETEPSKDEERKL